MSLPKDKIQEIARQVDANLNQSLNKLKSIVLWDNIGRSAMVKILYIKSTTNDAFI